VAGDIPVHTQQPPYLAGPRRELVGVCPDNALGPALGDACDLCRVGRGKGVSDLLGQFLLLLLVALTVECWSFAGVLQLCGL